MSDSKISALPAAATLTGAELVPVVQAGNSVRSTVSAIGNNALGTYTPPGIGAVARTVSSKLSDMVSVLDFGADPTGLTDSTAAVQNCINALPVSGGCVDWPAGVYLISSITINKQCLMQGSGALTGGTFIKPTSANANVFDITNSSVYIRDFLFFPSVTQTGGSFINCDAGSSIVTIEDCFMSGWFTGIVINPAGGPFYIRNVTMKNGVVGAGSGLIINNGTDVMIDTLIIDNAAGSQPLAGVAINACSDVTLLNCQLQHCVNSLSVRPGAGQVAVSIYALNCFFDNASSRGVYLSPSNSGGAIGRVRLTSCWASSSGNGGIVIDNSPNGGGIQGVEIIGVEAFFNPNGIVINVTGANQGYVDILGGKFAGNTNDGIQVFNCINGLKVIGVRAGTIGIVGSNGGFGLQISAGTCNGLVIADNDLTGNTTGAYSNASTGSNRRVVNNLGFNGGAATTSAITVAASPFTFTAGDTPITVYIFNGTVSAVSVDGASTFAATNCSVKLNCGKSVVVTYSVAPSMVQTLD
jgi:hypothetical protein